MNWKVVVAIDIAVVVAARFLDNALSARRSFLD